MVNICYDVTRVDIIPISTYMQAHRVRGDTYTTQI